LPKLVHIVVQGCFLFFAVMLMSQQHGPERLILQQFFCGKFKNGSLVDLSTKGLAVLLDVEMQAGLLIKQLDFFLVK
jgi:hypothetical protein